MKYLITGGAGFIGSNLVHEILARGEHVRVLDNFSTGKRENLADVREAIELLEGDIRSYHIVHEAVRGVDVILHQAALPSVPRSIADPITTHEVNTNGTLNVLNAARDLGVQRIVFASSSSIYGNSAELPKHEGMNPNPLSPYAVSKLTGEKYMQVFHQLYGLETVALRYFNVFGPRQDPNSQYSAVIPKFITGMLAGRAPVIYGDGEQTRDFTFVKNVVSANILAATASDDVGGAVMNIACHERISLNRLVSDINGIVGTSITQQYAAPRLGDVLHSFAAIARAREAIGYEPSMTWNDGLRATVDYYQKQLPVQRG
ncbi:MAG: SDR family oxidoreductase [Ignavibacteriae bacterium]|nr:SDR family oxidoreductase [Ignavibacteriota bacterium]